MAKVDSKVLSRALSMPATRLNIQRQWPKMVIFYSGAVSKKKCPPVLSQLIIHDKNAVVRRRRNLAHLLFHRLVAGQAFNEVLHRGFVDVVHSSGRSFQGLVGLLVVVTPQDRLVCFCHDGPVCLQIRGRQHPSVEKKERLWCTLTLTLTVTLTPLTPNLALTLTKTP